MFVKVRHAVRGKSDIKIRGALKMNSKSVLEATKKMHKHSLLPLTIVFMDIFVLFPINFDLTSYIT